LVYLFSMATSFTKAALGAEGVGSDVTMIVGNGYTKGHAEITLQILRESDALRKVFTELYS
ncbi:MAG: L-erythro-3,5-diaminohexanoate dehydrogenase, partial [Bacteroidales bacterium]|nr:L-erythro-3,5-diaminohexanoate dehydrogenase [Bacteroidales bacterium]